MIDKRYADFTNNYVVDAYTLFGIRAGFAQKDWEIFAEARNLANKKYVGIFSVVDIGKPDSAILSSGEPRSVYVGLKFRL